MNRQRACRAGVSLSALLLIALTSSCSHVSRSIVGVEGHDAANQSLTLHPMMEQVLAPLRQRYPGVFDDPSQCRVQVLLSIPRQERHDGHVTLERYTFRAGAEYFYPASSIKLLAAVAALEKLHAVGERCGNPLVSADTPITIAPLFDGDIEQTRDESNIDPFDRYQITVGHEIRKLFLVSDNQSFNRLFDVVGHQELNERMVGAGLPSVVINHRLSDSRRIPDARASAKVTLLTPLGNCEIPAAVSSLQRVNVATELTVGNGYMAGDKLIATPMDFTARNGISLVDLQNALILVTRPDIDLGLPGFSLDEHDRARLLFAMGQYPRESNNPLYDASHYPDEYPKFCLPGLQRVRDEAGFRIYNKIGQAYGFTVENAYIRDMAADRDFFLSAVIYTNADGILNDDAYEYTTLAEPFMADLAESAARAMGWSSQGRGAALTP